MSLLERLHELVGTPGEPYRAPDPVNEAMIRHWCEALGDTLPIYTDAEAAASSRHGGIVAPPAMLGAWAMRGLQPQPAGEAPRTKVMQLLEEAGYTSVVATNCEQEYVRYLRPGDRITVTASVEAVTGEKQTALGAGYFVTTLHEFRDAGGELVGTQRFRMLKFKPGVKAATAERRPRPPVNQDTEFFWEGVKRGELPIQRCVGCKTLRHPPRPSCGACGSPDWDTVASAGRGTLHSYTVHHHPPVPGLTTPYVVALIDLEEGTRIVSNLIEVDPAGIEIGMPVEVRFVAVDDELTLPLFAPRSGTGAA